MPPSPPCSPPPSRPCSPSLDTFSPSIELPPLKPIYRLSMYLAIFELPPQHPNQTDANYAWNLRCAKRSAAICCLLHATPRAWYAMACWLTYLKRLRSRARLHATRCASLPKPMIGYDVGVDSSGTIIIRTPRGNFINHHPSSPSISISSITIFSPNRDTILPRVPSSESRLVLCPEASGVWCYRHLDLPTSEPGTLFWNLPEAEFAKSSAFIPSSLSCLKPLRSTDLPPSLPPKLDLDSLERFTPYLPLYDDAPNKVLIYNRITGATRLAPWIALRDYGRIYFANLTTRETRWTPPPGWMNGWTSLHSPFTVPTYKGNGYTNQFSHYHRQLLPASLARQHVEGGSHYHDATGTLSCST